MANYNSWSYDDFNKFRKVYDAAFKSGQYKFMFQGKEYLTTYARYVIEYLTTMKKGGIK